MERFAKKHAIASSKKEKARIAASLLLSGARSWTRTNDPLINSLGLQCAVHA